MNNFNIEELTQKAEFWKEKNPKDQHLNDEINRLLDDPNELLEAFGKELKFGTSGMRGIMGYGTNRMNEHVIARATEGLANYLKKKFKSAQKDEQNSNSKNIKVIVAYDTRLNSDFFAQVTYSVLLDMGLNPILMKSYTPVSFLSYAILKTKAQMGVMITASHNPKIYNGYKVYNEDGYQILDDEANVITDEISKIEYFSREIKDIDNFEYLDQLVVEDFKSDIIKSRCDKLKNIDKSIKIVYTPLNGAGIDFVPEVLTKSGFSDTIIVKSQIITDGNFTTCPVPNPEKIPAYNEAFKLMDEIGADLIIATDPDCDRVGVAMHHNNMKVLLTGNQVGILLFDYLTKNSENISGKTVIRSIVSSPLVDKIAMENSMIMYKTLTGFKHMGHHMTILSEENRKDDFFFAFEESNGYLYCDFVRDKDGVSAALLVAEMAAYYKSIGVTLTERLNQIYDEFGVCHDKTKNFFFEGHFGSQRMKAVMDYFRYYIGNFFVGIEIIEKIDYLEEEPRLKSDVIEYQLRDGTKFMIRPSGTEPKLKVYIFGDKDTRKLEEGIKNIIDKFYN